MKNSKLGAFRKNSARLIVLVLFLLQAAAAAAAGAEDKADALLRHMLRGGSVEKLVLTRAIRGQETTSVIIEASQDISAQLQALGVNVRSVIDGDPVIITADVPGRALRQVLDIPELFGAHASRQLYTKLDRAIPESRVDQVWSTTQNGVPVRGRGVIVAVVDSGIDWRHGDFKDAQGNTRILEIWDQSASQGTPPQGFNYGNVCTSSQINQNQCSQADTNGHGTHVAGIAAGNGLSTNPAKYVGVAPEADLLIVKSSFGSAEVIDAWNYIVAKARSLGKPVVINNSFGGHSGPHDGTDPQEMTLDRLSGTGIVFAVAAGNEGDSPIHAQGTVAQGQSMTTTYNFPEPSPINQSLLTIWYPAADSMSVSVTAPNGEVFGPVAKGQARQFNGPDNTTITIDAQPTPGIPDSNTAVLLQRPSGQQMSGNWAFSVRADIVAATGRWDAWLATGQGAGRGTEVFTSNTDPRMTVGEPANARKAVTVASYVSKDCWSTAQGRFCYNPPVTVGDISRFSSVGPTRDGREKPDLAAPGQAVLSAKSQDTNPDPNTLDPDTVHVQQQGTSMASPMVSGAIALMLQVNPTMSADRVLEILRSSARVDSSTGATWNERWGRGKLDAKAAVDSARSGSGPATNFLYFPRLVHTPGEWMGVAVANTSQQQANVIFTAYNNSGSVMSSSSGGATINPSTQNMGARTQIANLASEIFGQSLNTNGGWIKIASNVTGLTGFYLTFDPALNTMDGADVSDKLLQELVIGETQNAEISLVNPSESQQANVTVRFTNNQGEVRDTQALPVPPNGRFSANIGGMFSSALISGGGYLSISSTPGLAAAEVFGAPGTYNASLNALDATGGARLLFSPQYAVGGGIWKTTLTVINLENAATMVSLSLIADNGSAIGRTAVVNIPPRGRVVISDPGVFGIVPPPAGQSPIEGYVRMTSDTRVTGYVRFGDLQDAQFQTALPFVTQGRTDVVYSQVAQDSTFFTGAAIINANTEPANVTVTVFNTDGVQVGAGTLPPIPPNGQDSLLLSQIASGLPAMSKGYFRISADRPVLSFAVFGTNTLSVLSAVPPQAIPTP